MSFVGDDSSKLGPLLLYISVVQAVDSKLGDQIGPKMGQFGPKWDKSGTFSDKISVHFGANGSNWPQMGQIRDFFR